jgi:hypothetical protein
MSHYDKTDSPLTTQKTTHQYLLEQMLELIEPIPTNTHQYPPIPIPQRHIILNIFKNTHEADEQNSKQQYTI